MNRTFYLLGIFYAGLLLITGLLESILLLRIGPNLYTREPYLHWFYLVNIITYLWAFLLLKYFHDKQYRLSFWAGLLFAIASLLYSLITLNQMVAVERSDYLMPAYIFTLGAGILYGLSLLFSKAANRTWLKAAGLSSSLLYLFLLSIHLWGMMYPDFMVIGGITEYYNWATLLGNIIPVFYILNFYSEMQATHREEELPGLQRAFNGFFAFTGTIAFISVLTYGQMLARESKWFSDWHNSIPAREEKLVRLFEERSFINKKQDTLCYLLLKPLDYKAIKKAGGNPRLYTEFPDAAHGIWEKVIETPDLLDWLFAQKKDCR